VFRMINPTTNVSPSSQPAREFFRKLNEIHRSRIHRRSRSRNRRKN
jgi:hypothetical protein